MWRDEENFHIGNENNKVKIDGNDLIINDDKFKGTEGLWRFWANPNKNKIDKETYATWWINKTNLQNKI